MTPADLRAQGHDAKAIAGFLGSEGVPSGGRVLDAPCGIGRRAIGLAAEGFHVTAVDSNEIGVDAARSRIPPDLRDRLRFLHAARESLPGLGEETFDAIVALDHPIGRQGPGEDVRGCRCAPSGGGGWRSRRRWGWRLSSCRTPLDRYGWRVRSGR